MIEFIIWLFFNVDINIIWNNICEKMYDFLEGRSEVDRQWEAIERAVREMERLNDLEDYKKNYENLINYKSGYVYRQEVSSEDEEDAVYWGKQREICINPICTNKNHRKHE